MTITLTYNTILNSSSFGIHVMLAHDTKRFCCTSHFTFENTMDFRTQILSLMRRMALRDSLTSISFYI
jgi:hypothetical protein